MKKLRNLYFIVGLFALAFALVARYVPGVTITDFVRGFFNGLGFTALAAGVVTAAIPHLYRKEKKDKTVSPDPSIKPEGGDTHNS